jgi:hypothetical protein
MRLLHQSCSYARVIEAAQRTCGYAQEDMAPYGMLLAAHADKWVAMLVPSQSYAITII